jgi:hypothetical protein
MRIFFKNRLAWYKFYRNSPLYHASCFWLAALNKMFFPGILSQIGRCRWIICIWFSHTTWLHTFARQTDDFQMPITLSKKLVCIWHSFYTAFWSPWEDASFAPLVSAPVDLLLFFLSWNSLSRTRVQYRGTQVPGTVASLYTKFSISTTAVPGKMERYVRTAV